jgi:hypothetical protein
MTADVSALHNWGHSDYSEAKEHIFAQLGRLDLDIFGRQVFVAVYTRPAYNVRSKMHHTGNEQQKDWIEGKVVLVVATGPAAFTSGNPPGSPEDIEYLRSVYKDGVPPKVGDWLFQNAATGIQFNFKGDGAERVKYEDRRGEMQDLYPADGWPVRILLDDSFLGRVEKPNSVV